jgi:FkbM family methyltransferase
MALLNLNHLKNKYSIEIRKIAHVGAHRGQEVKEYKDSFPNAEINLFEPQLNLFEDLKQKFKNDNNISLFNFALGCRIELSNMYISNNDGQSSSFYKPKQHLNEHPGVKFYKDDSIFQIKILDKLGINDIDFLNIDTQGFEMEVLKGSVNTLSQDVKCLIIEINKKELYEGCPLVRDVDVFLNKFGFVRTDTHYWMDTYSWGDAFYIKKDLISFNRYIFSVLKNYLYSFDILYMLLIKTRNNIWKLRHKK